MIDTKDNKEIQLTDEEDLAAWTEKDYLDLRVVSAKNTASTDF